MGKKKISRRKESAAREPAAYFAVDSSGDVVAYCRGYRSDIHRHIEEHIREGDIDPDDARNIIVYEARAAFSVDIETSFEVMTMPREMPKEL